TSRSRAHGRAASTAPQLRGQPPFVQQDHADLEPGHLPQRGDQHHQLDLRTRPQIARSQLTHLDPLPILDGSTGARTYLRAERSIHTFHSQKGLCAVGVSEATVAALLGDASSATTRLSATTKPIVTQKFG